MTARAPVLPEEVTFSFGDARELVLDTYDGLLPRGRRAWPGVSSTSAGSTRRCAPHKRGGAFCAYTVPSVHPYVMLNFTARRRDVLTMAHELGHGLHAALAQPQGVFHQSTPLTLAETASVFGETLVFGRLLDARRDDEDRLSLLAERIDGAVATVFRQMAMNRFEHLVHTRRRSEGELSVERFNDAWVESQTELFGDSVEMTDGYHIWWSYIPHFINTPGYVYAYAYGQLLALSVYQRYVEEGEASSRDTSSCWPPAARAAPRSWPRSSGSIWPTRASGTPGLELIEEQLRAAEELAAPTVARPALVLARCSVLVGPAGPRAVLVALHHLGDQPEDLLDPRRLGLAVGERLLPVGDGPLVASSLNCARCTSSVTFASDGMSLLIFGPGSSTR